MNYNFTGSVTERHINLGSAREISARQLAERARDERAVRHEIRRRHAAATRIQSVVRGRGAADRTRAHLHAAALQQLRGAGQASAGETDADFVSLTRLVAYAVRRPAIAHKARREADAVGSSNSNSSTSNLLSQAELRALAFDDEVLLAWAAHAVQPNANNAPIVLQSLGATPSNSAYLLALQSLVQSILLHIEFSHPSAQAGYLSLLAILSALISSVDQHTNKPMGTTFNTQSVAEAWSLWLIRQGLYTALRSHLLAFAPSLKTPPPTLAPAVSLTLAPLTLSSPVAMGKSNAALPRSAVLQGFIQQVLTIPNLPARFPRTSLVQLAVSLPLTEISDAISSSKTAIVDGMRSTHALANFVVLGWKRVPHLPDGASVKAYLLALTRLQDEVPLATLRVPEANQKISESSLLGDDDEGKDSNSGLSDNKALDLDKSTLIRLQILASQDHISAILTASARFPNSTREALCAFLASSLQCWDAQTQDKILATITYRYSGSSSQSSGTQAARSAAHSVGGLVRELWRGWIRGSKLSRSLSNEALNNRKAVLAVLADEGMASLWPCLVVMCQLYSRSLLTIGDDEFYPNDANGLNMTSSATSSMRNPLSLDEVVALSGLLRNLAFALYWYEGTGGVLNDLPGSSIVGMQRLDILSLRNVVTRLLQQLHQRDSRRRFAPEIHWLMTSELDLNTFIQSVVLEEDELNRSEDERDQQGEAMDMDQSERDDAAAVAARLSGRPAISSRLANRRSTAGGRGNRGLTARSLAFLSPRLGVLNNIPFVIPFEVRVEIFHQFTALDYARLRKQKSLAGPLREVTIRRTSVAEDGFKQLNGLGEHLKHKFFIKFIDQFGMQESGIDGGGLFKEFLTSLIKEAFDTDRGLWSATADQQLYPNPHAYAKSEENLQWYRFLGRILGKALYEGILVDINFAGFFLNKWLGRGHGYLDDLSGLESLDKDVYRNLLWLKHYAGDVEKDLALDFTVVDEEFGMKHVRELVPDGKNIPVTRENRLEYIYRVSHYRLNEQIRPQSDAFMSGLTDLIDLRWLRMLNREELQVLISGADGDIDLADLRRNTVLGGYHEQDEVLGFFWSSLESFSSTHRKAFLKFATSCPSPPLLGFQQLNPKFGIRNAGDDTTRLPTASTCVNLLKLPRYITYEQCREKLLYSIEAGAGFDLS